MVADEKKQKGVINIDEDDYDHSNTGTVMSDTTIMTNNSKNQYKSPTKKDNKEINTLVLLESLGKTRRSKKDRTPRKQNIMKQVMKVKKRIKDKQSSHKNKN